MGILDADFKSPVFTHNNPIILAQNRAQAILNSVRLAFDADGYPTGTTLARNNVSGYYQKYDDGAASGLNTAAAILLEDHPVSGFADSDDTNLAVGIFGGQVWKQYCLGLDANAITDLAAKTIIDAAGNQILKF